MQQFFIKILTYAGLLIVLNLALGFYLKSYESKDLTESGIFFPTLRWADYYAFSDSIDLLTLGSSHAYRTFDPQAMEAALPAGIQVFNFGSSAQSPVTAYYILQEVLQKHHPKLVVMDVYPLVFMGNDQLDNGLINFETMRTGRAKRDFFRHGFSLNEQVAIRLFPTYVYRQYLKGKIKKLLGQAYLPPAKGQYRGDGFVSNPDTLSLGKLQYDNQFDRFDIKLEDITEKNITYLRRMVADCRTAGIPIIFTVAPIPEISVQKIENYRQLSGFFQQLADELSVPYYDFNLKRIPQLKDEFHYYDDDHLNAAGARLFSKTIAPELGKMMME